MGADIPGKDRGGFFECLGFFGIQKDLRIDHFQGLFLAALLKIHEDDSVQKPRHIGTDANALGAVEQFGKCIQFLGQCRIKYSDRFRFFPEDGVGTED